MFANSNGRQFQKGLDHAAARANRHSATLSLRRQQREQHLQKKVRLLSHRKSNGESNINNDNNNTEHAYISSIPKYVANIMQPESESLQLRGLIAIRKLLSVERDLKLPTDRIISSGVLPKIIQFMFENNYRLAFESAWAITNIAAASDCCLPLVKHGAINAFIHILKGKNNFNNNNNNNNNNNIEIISQSIWGLGNISGDEKKFGNIIIDSGICNHIISILLSNDCQLELQLFNNGMWAIHNYIRVMNEQNLTFSIFKNKYNNLCELICKILSECRDCAILSDTLWCVCTLTNNINDDNLMNYIIFGTNNNENKIINLCMKLLNLEIGKYEIAMNNNKTVKDAMITCNYKIYKPCLRFFGNLLTGADNITQAVINCGYLDCIEPFLNHFLVAERRELLWALSNICAGNHQQIEYILSREKLTSKIISYAINDKIKVRFEAIMCICNMTFEAIPSQKKRLAEYGAINALCQLLNPINNINDKQIRTVIEGLNEFLKTFNCVKYSNPFANMIEECNGLTYLENRIADETIDENTYNALVNLVKSYWDENENIKPIEPTKWCNNNIDKKTNQFKFGLNNTINNNNETFAF